MTDISDYHPALCQRCKMTDLVPNQEGNLEDHGDFVHPPARCIELLEASLARIRPFAPANAPNPATSEANAPLAAPQMLLGWVVEAERGEFVRATDTKLLVFTTWEEALLEAQRWPRGGVIAVRTFP